MPSKTSNKTNSSKSRQRLRDVAGKDLIKIFDTKSFSLFYVMMIT